MSIQFFRGQAESGRKFKPLPINSGEKIKLGVSYVFTVENLSVNSVKQCLKFTLFQSQIRMTI